SARAALSRRAAQLPPTGRKKTAAPESDRAGDDLAGRIGHEPHDRKRRRALAAAGFADDRERLSCAQKKRHVVDGVDGVLAHGEYRAEPVDLEHIRDARGSRLRRLDFHQWRSLGSSKSRKASPSKLVPNTTRLMATQGKITSQGAVRTYSAADSESIRPQEG